MAFAFICSVMPSRSKIAIRFFAALAAADRIAHAERFRGEQRLLNFSADEMSGRLHPSAPRAPWPSL